MNRRSFQSVYQSFPRIGWLVVALDIRQHIEHRFMCEVYLSSTQNTDFCVFSSRKKVQIPYPFAREEYLLSRTRGGRFQRMTTPNTDSIAPHMYVLVRNAAQVGSREDGFLPHKQDVPLYFGHEI